MEDMIGKKYKITILKQSNNTRLFYTGYIIDVTNIHISFKDKYNILRVFLKTDIEEMEELEKQNGRN